MLRLSIWDVLCVSDFCSASLSKTIWSTTFLTSWLCFNVSIILNIWAKYLAPRSTAGIKSLSSECFAPFCDSKKTKPKKRLVMMMMPIRSAIFHRFPKNSLLFEIIRVIISKMMIMVKAHSIANTWICAWFLPKSIKT